MELCDFSALELTRLLHGKQASAVEIINSALERIAAVDGQPGSLAPDPALSSEDQQKVHAFISLTAEAALAQAAEIDKKVAAGEDPGPLAGVPFTVKDIFCVKDTHSTAASKILANDADRGVTAFMPLAIGVYEDKKGQVYVSQLNVGLLGMMFGGTIADVMGAAGKDLNEVVSSVAAK